METVKKQGIEEETARAVKKNYASAVTADHSF